VKGSVKEWTFTLPRELPPWELESQWTSKCSKNDCKGQNLMNWRIIYTIGKLLKFRCQNGLAWPIWTSKTQVMPKEGSGVKLPIWLPSIKKSRIDPISLCVGGVWHIVEKLLMRATILLQTSFQSEVSTQSYGPQSCRNPNFENFKTPIWESQDKMSFGCEPRGKAQSIL